MGYIYFNPNPMKKSVGDCTIRAISLLMDKEWREIYIGLVSIGFEECDMPASNAIWSKYLYLNGYSRKPIPNTCPYCYTVSDFCKDHPNGSYLLATGSHVVTIVNGDYYDTWDSGDQTPIFYWLKETEK